MKKSFCMPVLCADTRILDAGDYIQFENFTSKPSLAVFSLLDAVHIVQFTISLNDFDLVTKEEGKNRLELALEYFDEISKMKVFEKSSFIVLLTKRDLFEKKLTTKKFKTFFKDYKFKKEDTDSVAEYIRQRLTKNLPHDRIMVKPFFFNVMGGFAQFMSNFAITMGFPFPQLL